MKGLVVRHRKLGYTKTIFPFDEDCEYWYVPEIQDKKILETLHYSKHEFDFMGVSNLDRPKIKSIVKHL
jgi:hypothetical protein